MPIGMPSGHGLLDESGNIDQEAWVLPSRTEAGIRGGESRVDGGSLPQREAELGCSPVMPARLIAVGKAKDEGMSRLW